MKFLPKYIYSNEELDQFYIDHDKAVKRFWNAFENVLVWQFLQKTRSYHLIAWGPFVIPCQERALLLQSLDQLHRRQITGGSRVSFERRHFKLKNFFEIAFDPNDKDKPSIVFGGVVN